MSRVRVCGKSEAGLPVCRFNYEHPGPCEERSRGVSTEDFDWFGESSGPDPEVTDSDRQRSLFVSSGKGSRLRVGAKTFEVFADQGITKYATLSGTAGKKFYRLQPTSFNPFEVEARQVVGQAPEVLSPEVVAKGRVS